MTSAKFSGLWTPPSFHCQYQIHATSLPLVTNWPPQPPLSDDVIYVWPQGKIRRNPCQIRGLALPLLPLRVRSLPKWKSDRVYISFINQPLLNYLKPLRDSSTAVKNGSKVEWTHITLERRSPKVIKGICKHSQTSAIYFWFNSPVW